MRLEMDAGPSGMDLWTDVLQSREFHHGVMSSAAIPPGSVHPVSLQPVKGATALGNDPGPGTAARHEHRYVVGNALRAIKVFATAAFSVVVMGEYAND
ncbi:hypothetical protein Stube_25810 [Streptomyces tubercidicus]|uniref:Uncharacterized protein n=2 Tax=Streptomyces tubercidicus TaxID=47759 RepID=A0A640UPA3_9ACTN|nr:hypothetical protein Stube_25810 [Streptomyces tubercidicus]